METQAIDLEDIGVIEFLLERLNEDYAVIEGALDFSAMGEDERTELHEVRFTALTLGPGNSIHLEYEYDWSLYHGCKDVSASGSEEARIIGTFKDGKFEFPVIPSSRERSTDEEF